MKKGVFVSVCMRPWKRFGSVYASGDLLKSRRDRQPFELGVHFRHSFV